GGDGTPRFSMLATIQEYAHELMEAQGERPTAEARHVDFFRALVEAAEPHLYRPERELWMERLSNEILNLRLALAWFRDSRAGLESGLQMAGALTLFWYQGGHVREGLTWLEEMLARTSAANRSHARARALHGAGFLSWKQANLGAGARYAEEALSIFRERGERLWFGQAEWVLAISRLGQRREAEARPLLEECLTIFREADSAWGVGMALAFLGISSRMRGDHAQALSLFREGHELFRQNHDVVYTAVSLA